MMTESTFRKLALALPESVESSHMGHPDFRVRNKIFASLMPDEGWGMVKLTPSQQEYFIESSPDAFMPVPGGWGRRGATRVVLKAVLKSEARNALAAAWRNVAPKSLVQLHDE